jgi:ribosome-binding ATPase YchF (GTP1/OBG family)
MRAETSYEDLIIECGSEANAKSQAMLRSEGKDYVVREGDVITVSVQRLTCSICNSS